MWGSFAFQLRPKTSENSYVVWRLFFLQGVDFFLKSAAAYLRLVAEYDGAKSGSVSLLLPLP